MPRIALVSDTHLPRFGLQLPAALREALLAVAPDVILHLGDHTAAFVVDHLGDIARVEAVAGNNDPPEVVTRHGMRRVVTIGGLRIGLTHGHLGTGATTPDRAFASFAGDDVGLVAFGHSHIPLVEWRGGRLLVNPGSPTDQRRQPFPTFAIVDVAESGGPAAPPLARIIALPAPQHRQSQRTGGGAGSTD